MPSILIISHNEICYNARLLKAADFFHERGWSVTAFNGVTGIAPKEVYEDVKSSRSWMIIENDISKRGFSSKLRWMINGLLFKMVQLSVDRLKMPYWSKYYLNKTLILAPSLNQRKFDYILIHLVDTLPFAIELKEKVGAKLIYDNQEYFVGQYSAFEENKYRWVKNIQDRYIHEADIILATTKAMADQLRSDYQLSSPVVRVRNVPIVNKAHDRDSEFDVKTSISHQPLKLIWHGMWVYFNNRRGVHILLKAIALCTADVQLFLQGNLTQKQKEIFEEYHRELKLGDKVKFMPVAHPDRIVDSLRNYDIGLTPEIPEEMNQELTSSNKLFDYIHAGLAVISSDVLGLSETIDEFELGLKFPAGNEKALSQQIDFLAKNKVELNRLKKNSINASKELLWEKDYSKVLEVL